MLSRVMFLGFLGLACTVNAQEPDKSGERAGRVRALQRRIMDLESIGRTTVLQERGLQPLLRPPVNPAYNVENFAPVMAHFVRFTVLATVNGNEPCLDALEINSADRSANLTQVARRTLDPQRLGHGSSALVAQSASSRAGSCEKVFGRPRPWRAGPWTRSAQLRHLYENASCPGRDSNPHATLGRRV